MKFAGLLDDDALRLICHAARRPDHSFGAGRIRRTDGDRRQRELRAYLACGMLPFGFLRVRCQDCGQSRIVAFSCKKRGFCPSCTGRRMADTAARLTDEVLPEVPVRQWVLSLPYETRFRLAWDGDLLSAVLAVFLRVVYGWRLHRAGLRV